MKNILNILSHYSNLFKTKPNNEISSTIFIMDEQLSIPELYS